MPSIALEVSATLSIGPVPRLQASTAAPQGDAQPFAALLDASTDTRDATSTTTAQAPASFGGTTQSTGGGTTQSTGGGTTQSTGGGTTQSTGAATAAPNATDIVDPTKNGKGNGPANPNAATGNNAVAIKGGKTAANAAATGNSPQPATNANNPVPIATNGGNLTAPATNAASTNAKTVSNAKGQASSPDTQTTNGADIAAAPADVLASSGQQPAKAVSPTKASSTASQDDGGGTDTTAISGTSQPQAEAKPAQAVAVILGATANTAPGTQASSTAPVNAPDISMAVGEALKARVTSTLPLGSGQEAASARDATGAAPSTQAPSAGKTDNAANAADAATNPFDETADAQAANSGSLPQAPTPSADDASVPAQISASVLADADHATAQVGQVTQPSTISSSDTGGLTNTQSSTSAAQPDVGGLPNFGFSAASTPPPSTTTAALSAGMSTASAVPIAGLAVAISARAQAGSNQFEITLAPPELGRIVVHLDVDDDGQATSHVTVERADTLQLLQSQQPQLQSALEQAGLKTADNGLQFTLGDQSFTGQNSGSGSQSTPAQLVIPEADLAPVAATQIYTRAAPGGGVDIRV